VVACAFCFYFASDLNVVVLVAAGVAVTAWKSRSTPTCYVLLNYFRKRIRAAALFILSFPNLSYSVINVFVSPVIAEAKLTSKNWDKICLKGDILRRRVRIIITQ
jgi:hypothetical protein